ncbi:MAG: hypothetical protein ABJA78_16635 [Ferruginibacter sp.]
MKKILFTTFLLSAICSACFCQKPVAHKPSAPLAQKPKPDVQLSNLAADIKKLGEKIADPQVRGSSMVQHFLYSDADNNRYYTPDISVSGSIDCYIKKKEASRKYWQQTGWEYHCLLAKLRPGSDSARLAKTYAFVVSLLKTLPLHKAEYANVNEVRDAPVMYSSGSGSADSLAFVITYYKLPEGDPAAIADSIGKVYLPGIKNEHTSASARKQYFDAMKFEGVDDIPETYSAYAKLINEVDHTNPEAAFRVMMEMPTSEPALKNIKDLLEPAANNHIVAAATAYTQNYKRQQDSSYYATYYPDRANPYAVTNSYSSNSNSGTTTKGCEENTRNQHFRTGVGINALNSFGNDEYFVSGFDCYKNQYTVVRLSYVAPKKTFFKSDVNVAHNSVSQLTYPAENMAKYFRENDNGYTLCPVCGGTGCGQVTQVRTAGGWEALNFNTSVYSDPHTVAQWNERVTCNRCYGTGKIH